MTQRSRSSLLSYISHKGQGIGIVESLFQQIILKANKTHLVNPQNIPPNSESRVSPLVFPTATILPEKHQRES